METVIERIYKIVDTKGDSIYKLSKEIGVSNGYFSKQKQSEGSISSNIIEKIVNYYNDIDANWLITGEGSMLKPPLTYTEDHPHSDIVCEERVPYGKPIPLIPLDAFAGFSSNGGSQVMEYECEKYVVPDFKGAEFLIQVKGSSMYPKYSSGDIVACKKLPLDTFFQWNKVYVVDSEQGVMIKRIKKGIDENHIQLVSENPSYEPFELHRDQITSLAIVIGVIRLE